MISAGSLGVGFVYFMRPVGRDGPIKIGFSLAPEKRLAEVQQWAAFPLEIIGTVRGTVSQEMHLHSRFADCHSHGEWFDSTPELRATIRELLAVGSLDDVLARLPKKGNIRRKGKFVAGGLHS